MSSQTKTRLDWPVENSGELRHRIMWLSQVVAPGDSGTEVSWAPDSPPRQSWARIEPLSAEETIKAGQDIAVVVAAVTVRYRSWITDTMRFVSPNGRVWVIKAIRNLKDMNIWMVMTCIDQGPYAA